ncbi:MAG TPA: BNR repeat-containing protein [Bacillota bacterium]|nr:BNR repeat-containing protein [Bacillota bacterium]
MRQKTWTILLGACLILSLFLTNMNVIAAPGVSKTQETTVTTSALSLVISTDYYLNGCSYQQDAIITVSGWQYTTFYNSSRQVCVARRQLPGGSWQILTLTDYTQSTNDAHNTISMGIGINNGTIHLAFDHHDSTLHYRKSTTGVTTNPSSINWSASLFGAVTSQLVSGTTITGLTYPRFVTTPQGDLLFEARLGSSGNGQDYLWEYNCSTGLWTSLGLYISNPNGGNAYINGIHFDKSNKLHVSWVKRDTPDATTNHDLHYIYSTDNGRTWCNNSGTVIGTTGSDPVTIEEPKIWTIPTNSGLINQEAQAIDNQGRIHLLMRKTVNGTNYQFHYWRGTDGVWHETNTNIPTKYWYRRSKIVIGGDDNVYAVMPDLLIASASVSTNWTDWAIVNRGDENKYHSEPLIDWNRLYKGDGILSVVYQQKSSGTLKVLDYQLGVAGPTPTPTRRVATPTPTRRGAPTPTPRRGTITIVNDNTTGTGTNQFEYVQSWSYGTQTGAYNSDNHWSSVTNAYYQFRFNGTQIKIYGAKASNHGIAAVSIDGGAETNVDFYAASRQEQALVYSSPSLAVGPHTLKVRVTGTKNASASSTIIPVDRVDITN